MLCKKKSTCSKYMSEVARNSGELLEQESTNQITSFLMDQITMEGGFKGRTKSSDLYYTLFGMECLLALGNSFPFEKIEEYLNRFKDGDGLDFVHLSCLARCLAKLPDSKKHFNTTQAILQKLELYRSSNGGYRLSLDAAHDSIYASFLAFLAHEDTGVGIRNPGSLIRCIKDLETGDGAFADRPGVSIGTTTVTAAAVVLLSYLGETVASSVSNWLLSRCSKFGGFLATAHAPAPDLVSTATALFALKTTEYPIEDITESMLTFIEEMWDDCGGFRGHIFDKTPDCEYTFYGLLSLGILG